MFEDELDEETAHHIILAIASQIHAMPSEVVIGIHGVISGWFDPETQIRVGKALIAMGELREQYTEDELRAMGRDTLTTYVRAASNDEN